MSCKKLRLKKASKSRVKKIRERYLSALEQSYPKHIPKYSLGNCGIVAELIAREMVRKGLINYRIIQGIVVFSNGKSHAHTWMEYGNTKYDPCLEQFGLFGDDYDITSVKYVMNDKMAPAYYVKICKACPLPDDYIRKVIKNELKTSRYNIAK